MSRAAPIACCAASSPAWYSAVYGDGSAQWLYLGMCSAALSLVLAACHTRGPIKIRSLPSQYSRMFVMLEEALPPLMKLRLANQKMLEGVAQRGGRAFDAELHAASYTRLCVMMCAPCIAASAFGAAFLDYAWIALCGAPAAIYAAPYARLQMRVRARREAVSGEAAYFLSYVNIMQSAGVGLYRSFEIIYRSGGAFPAMSQDAASLCRRIITGSTRNESLLNYAAHHPVRIIRDFVAGYVAKQAALGDVPGYTAQKAQQAFSEYESAWSRYEKSVQEIFGGIMMFAIMLPLMIMLSAMLGTPQTVRTLLAVGTAISPAVSLCMVLLLDRAQPPAGSPLKLWVWSAACGAAVLALCFALGAPDAVAVSAGAAAFAASNCIRGRRGAAMARASERMLPEFLQDMTEMSRAGSSVSRIICRQARQGAYGPHFGGMLERAAGRIMSGVPLEEALRAGAGAGRNVRFVMFILGAAHRTGSDMISILEMITEFADRIHQTKESVTKSLAPLCYVVYATPFVTLGLAYLMLGIFAGSASDMVQDGSMPFSPISGDVLDEYVSGMGMMSAAMSIPMGAVAAKVSSYTVRDTLPLALVASCNIAAILSMPYVMGLAGLA